MKNLKTIFLALAVILLFCCCNNKATKTYGEETNNSSQNENTNIAVTESEDDFSNISQGEPTGGTFYVSSGTGEYKLQFGWEQYFVYEEQRFVEQGLCVGKFSSDGWLFTISGKDYDSEIKESDYAVVNEYEEAYYSFVNSLSAKLEEARQSLKSLTPDNSIQNEAELQEWVKANKAKVEAELSKCAIPYDVTYYYIKRIPSKSENDYWIAGKDVKGSGYTEIPMM